MTAAAFFSVTLASFAYVALKAFQQRNVMADQWLAVIPTSFGMAATEVYVVGSIAVRTLQARALPWELVLAMGLGGTLGCLSAMWLHRRLFKGKRYG